MKTVSALPKGSLIDAGGNPSPQMVAFLQKIEKRANEAPDLSGVTDITPGSTAAATTSRTVTDSSNGLTGVDPGGSPVAIGYESGPDSVQLLCDNFTILKNLLNDQFANDTNLGDAVDELNARLTALETAFQELRSALTA